MKKLHHQTDEINDSLAQEMPRLCEALGLEVNHRLSNKWALRFGRKGSLKVNIAGPHKGSWKSFEDDEKGGPLKLIERVQGCDWRAARDWAVNHLGWSSEAPPNRPTVKRPKPAPVPDEDDDVDAYRERRATLAGAIYDRAWPIAGTPAETYLRSRGIVGDLPSNLRWVPMNALGYGTLVVPGTNDAGGVRVIQQIRLTEDGHKAPVEVVKPTMGSPRGAPARFPGKLPLVIAEGPETALSVWLATGRETWAALGTSNLASAPVPPSEPVTIAADDFASGSQAEAATHNAARIFAAIGCEVRVTSFPPGGGDFNDVHQRSGLNAVREIIEAASVWAESDVPTGVPLAEGVAELERNIDDFVYFATEGYALAKSQPDTSTLPIKPFWIIRATTGTGKSRLTNRAVGEHLSNGGGPVCAFAPTVALAQQQANDFTEATGRPAAVWRGLTQDDPEDPDGGLMCRNPKLSTAAVNAGVKVDSVCKICTKRGECGYVRQQSQKADVWFLAHEMLFYRRPPGVPNPDFIVVDEDFRQAGMKQNLKLPISALEASLEGDLISADSRKLLAASRGALARALRACMCGYLTAAALHDAGITAGLAAYCHDLEWDRKPGAQISEDEEATIRSLHDVVAKFSFRIPKLWGMAASVLRGDYEYTPGVEVRMDTWPDGNPMEAVLLNYRETVNEAWLGKPALFLDATARPEVVQHYFPMADIRADIHVSAPHERVVWVNYPFSKARLIPSKSASERYNRARLNNLEKVRRWIEVRAAATWDRMLVICNLDVERLLKQGPLPQNVVVSHFNANRGVNAWGRVHWSDVGTLAIVGRTLPDARTIQKQAEQFAGRPLAEDHELVQAVRWLICEAELINGAIGRGRGVHRVEDNPLEIYLLNDVPLPIAYDAVTSWEEAQPSAADILAVRGVFGGDMSQKGYWNAICAVLPDLFPTPDAARKAFSRGQTSMDTIYIDVCPRESRRGYLHRVKPEGARYSVEVRLNGCSALTPAYQYFAEVEVLESPPPPLWFLVALARGDKLPWLRRAR